MKSFTFGALAFLCPIAVIAAEEKKSVDAEIEAGITLISGNTESNSFRGKLNITHDLKNWKNQYVVSGIFREDENLDKSTGEEAMETTAEKYFASARSGFKIDDDHKEFFLYGEYDDNRFSAFEFQYSISIGYSDRFFTRDNSYFSYSIGPGYSVDQPVPVYNEGLDAFVDVEKEQHAIVFASLEYAYKFSAHSRFKQTVHTNFATENGDNTKTRSVSSISADINSSITLKTSYTVDYNTEVPAGTDHADTETSLTLVYSFL